MKFSIRNKPTSYILVALCLLNITSCQQRKELHEVAIPEREHFKPLSQYPNPSTVKSEHGPFEPEGFTYDYDGFDAFLSAENLYQHHHELHVDYTNQLNHKFKKRAFDNQDINSLLKNLSADELELLYVAGGHQNHNLYWKSITTETNQTPDSLLSSAINRDFNNLKELESEILTKSMQLKGSGWVWIVSQQGTLKVWASTLNNNPLMQGYSNGTPLLALDLWEHAYYPTYRNDKKRYVEDFIKHINWHQISSRYQNLITSDS